MNFEVVHHRIQHVIDVDHQKQSCRCGAGWISRLSDYIRIFADEQHYSLEVIDYQDFGHGHDHQDTGKVMQ